MKPSETSGVRLRDIIQIAIRGEGRGRHLAFATMGLMAYQACEAAVPILIGVIIDRAIAPERTAALVLWVALLGVTFLVLSLSFQRAVHTLVRVRSEAEHALRQQIVSRVLHPRGGSAAVDAGQSLSIATSDTGRVAGITLSIAEQLATLMAILVAAVALLVISVPLGLGVVLGTALVLGLLHVLATPIERAGMVEQEAVAHASATATDALAGLRVLHGLGAFREMSRRYREASTQSRQAAVRSSGLLLNYHAVSAAVSVLSLAVLALIAGWLAWAGRITPGQLVMVVGLAQFLQGALTHVGTFAADWSHKRASARRLQAALNDPYLLVDGDLQPQDTPESLLLWSLPGEGQFEVQADEGLIGVRVRSAAEARYVSDALGLRHRPAPGSLRVGGVDVESLAPEAYLHWVVALPHEAMLFSGSVRDNIAGESVIDQDVVRAVALDDVLEQVGGLDAPVGERGRRLSGGQRQRVGLARALHSTAELVVFEEPTTAVDPLTEYRIGQGLCALGRPIVAVTSSPVLLAACERVWELPAQTELQAP